MTDSPSHESSTSSSPLDAIADIKRRIAEISFAPLSEHGSKFEEVNTDLSNALHSVEGISG